MQVHPHLRLLPLPLSPPSVQAPHHSPHRPSSLLPGCTLRWALLAWLLLGPRPTLLLCGPRKHLLVLMQVPPFVSHSGIITQAAI